MSAAPNMSAVQVCVVVGAGSAVTTTLAGPLAANGYAVALVSDQSTDLHDEKNITSVPCKFDTRAGVDLAFDQAVARCGIPQLLVLSMIPASLMRVDGIDEVPSELWTETLPAAALGTLYALQACHRLLQGMGGTIVLVGPALSLVGASGLSALSTLLEAQRALAKSAARQWGRLGIRVHWIALGCAGNYGELNMTSIPVGPELGPPPPALGRVPGYSDIAPLIAFLGGSGASALTGTTLVADGGNWMVP
jgi:NAD(P)-dependent dehydrogenase (short-subunit alcohol dehydrogenase family)